MTTQARELAKLVSNAGDLTFGDDIHLLSDAGVLNFGADNDVTLTHVADTGLLLNSSRQLQFGDSGTFIRQEADGVLDLTSDTEIELNATTLDINANVDISGTLTVAGNLDFGDAVLSNVGAVQLDSIAGDGDTNTSITFSGSDVITIATGGSGRLTIGDGALSPVTDNQIDLGTSSLEFKDAFFDGTVTSDAFAGPLTGDVTGNADTATVATTVTITDNESTNENNAVVFTAGGDVDGGNLGLESDGNLTYNPSSGTLTATAFAGALTGDVTGNVSGTAATVTTAAQSAITSVGTLTGLTVSGSTTLSATSFGEADLTNVGTIYADQYLGDADADTGIVLAGSNVMTLHTNNAERMRFTSDGKVGIGTASPTTTLHATTGTNGSGLIDVARFQNAGTTVDDGARIQLTAGTSTSGAGIGCLGDALNSAHLVLHSGGNTERMRITSDGKVGIGATSPTGTLEVRQTQVTTQFDRDSFLRLHPSAHTNSGGFTNIMFGTSTTNNYGVAIGGLRAGTNDAPSFIIRLLNDSISGTEVLRINSSGRQAFSGSGTINAHATFVGEVGTGFKALAFERTVGGGEVGTIVANTSSTSYNTSSDYRLKENVDYTWDATTRLKQLKPARFNWIADDTNTLLEGFLAHEVSSIVPEAVSGEKDAVDGDDNPDYQGIDQSKLVPLLVKTIQELEARITTLEG